MVFSRSPGLMTERLRKIINRDTILIVSIVAPFASFLDVVIDKELHPDEKLVAYVLIGSFIATGLIRLKRGSILDRKPIYAIIVYQLILIPVIAYFSNTRSFYIFIWLIPIFLSGFYYGKKVIIGTFVTLAITQIAKGTYYGLDGYITDPEDYLYLIGEFFIVLALGLLIIDTIAVTEEDRVTLVKSLNTTEIEQERLGALINSISDGVVAVDNQLGIISCNASALSILDTHGDIIGQNFAEVCHIETLDGKMLNLSTLSTAKFEDYECIITYSDGERATLSLSAVPIRTKTNQESQGYVFVLRDVTKQKSLEQERNAFVSLMSHELRTPLTIAEGSISNAEVIAKSGDANKTAEVLKTAAGEITQLVQLTNEFSLVIDSTANKENVQKKSVNLDELRQKLESEYVPQAREKSIVFSILIAPNTPHDVYTSPEYLEHVIRSLLDNAVKFTSAGSVSLQVRQEADRLLFVIEDTGSGIPKSDQPKLFSPFYQSDDYQTRTHGGLGIGLYISKRLADIIGATLTFTSEKDRGTAFTFSLPLEHNPIPKSVA